MTQNIYDNQDFFDGYAQLGRSVYGLEGAPEWPALLKMLPEMEGRRVIDLGCGYGWFCRSAREQGASKVLGLDVSQKMLAKAEELTTDNAIIYRQEDMEQLALPKAEFDLAYSSLALHYIKHLAALFEQIYGSLSAGGYFVFSVEHPIYTSPRQPGWLIDSEGKKSWPVNNYQLEGDRVTNWLADGVIKQHRTIGTYLNLLIQQGFTIKHVEEWGPSEKQVADNPELEEEKERPMLLLVSVQK